MNTGKSLEDRITRYYAIIWDDEKIAKRPLWVALLIPVALGALCVWLKLAVFKSSEPPFLAFFVVVIVSACYGGIKAAVFSVFITSLYSFVLIFLKTGNVEPVTAMSILQVLLYFVETIFFTALLHRSRITEKRCKSQYDDLIIIKNQILRREKTHEDFVHMATHELKAPVTVLKAYLQLAEMKTRIAEPTDQRQATILLGDFAELAEKMNFQLDRLINLINDLSESSRIKSGALHYQMKPFDMVRCVSDCVAGFRAAHVQANITFQTSTSILLVYGDEARLEQVILNLLSNAIKYTNSLPQIQVECALRDGNVIVFVQDNGIGIPENEQSSVFKQFYRVDSPEMKDFPGLGLGLYICAEIIKYHKGEISVKSRLNDGATFWFSLPLHKGA